jgi:hypothetical protein
MSRDRLPKSRSEAGPERPLSGTSGVAQPSVTEVSAYVSEIVRGVRRLTRRPNTNKDLEFLDRLLAMAEHEADTLAANVYH